MKYAFVIFLSEGKTHTNKDGYCYLFRVKMSYSIDIELLFFFVCKDILLYIFNIILTAPGQS